MSAAAAAERGVGAFAPATIANVGPGFDCFGFSLGEPGDAVWARVVDQPGVRIREIRGDDGRLPRETARNCAGRAAEAVWEGAGPLAQQHGLELTIEKGLPLSAGLGGSAASAVAGALAAMLAESELAGAPYDRARVLRAALLGEAVAAGAAHADNVAPALLGGFTIVQAAAPLNIARFEPVLPCRVAAVTPALEVSTKAAREALPRQIPLADGVANCANAASLVLALTAGDAALLRAALVDRFAEPYRAKLIPGFADAKRRALDAGAYGCSIGGSGPTVFALTPDEPTAQAAAAAIAEVFAGRGLVSQTIISSISPLGARRR